MQPSLKRPGLLHPQNHEHAVLFCDRPKQWCEVAVSFLAQGLANREPTICLHGMYPSGQVLSLLGQALASAGTRPSIDRLQIKPVTQILISKGYFDAQAARENLLHLIGEASRTCSGQPRLLLDMNWGSYLGGGIKQLLECEHWLNEELRFSHSCVVLCHYERVLFAPAVLRAMREQHGVVLEGREAEGPDKSQGAVLEPVKGHSSLVVAPGSNHHSRSAPAT